MSDYPSNRPRFADILNHAHQLQELLSQEGYEDSDIIASLESETEVLAIMDRTIERVIADERLAASARERARRLEARAEMRRGLLHVIMTSLQRQNLERPLATVYYQANPQSVTVERAEEIPAAYTMTVPDKTAILKALKAGEAVPGVSLSPAKTSLRIKTT